MSSSLDITPEQSRQLADNRLRAKQKLLEKAREQRLHNDNDSTTNKRKQPIGVTPASSTSPTSVSTRSFPTAPFPKKAGEALQNATGTASTSKSNINNDEAPLPRDVRLGKYVEFDLSKLRNSKGGFLVEGEDEASDERAARQKRQTEELRKQRLRESERMGLGQDPAISLNRESNPKCKICGTVELDFQIYKIFGEPVCPKCRNENPEQFSLLTKTECKEDYLLTDPELRDEELLPHMLKPNPHRSTYSNMMLFLREQVEAYAFSDKKWGSAEKLDQEFERREKIKKDKKNKKFENKLRDLRKRTRPNVWHARKEAEHKHDFVDVQDGVQRCSGCGLTIEGETF